MHAIFPVQEAVGNKVWIKFLNQTINIKYTIVLIGSGLAINRMCSNDMESITIRSSLLVESPWAGPSSDYPAEG